MPAKPMQEEIARRITGLVCSLLLTADSKLKEITIMRTLTVFTSHISVLGPVTNMKESISNRPHKPVTSQYNPCINSM